MKKSDYGTKAYDKEKFIKSNQLQHFLSEIQCRSVEATNDANSEIIAKSDAFHGFVRAMEIAYFKHYPLRIKVSHVWLLILHALSQHLDNFHKKLRKKYVSHKGKKTLVVARPNFAKGSKTNDWEPVIDEFAQQIDKCTRNGIAKIVENDFSVSTKLEKIASKVALMSACKHC